MRSFYLTADDNKKLHCVDFCENIKNPRLIVQICHGMAEHIQRYKDFSLFLEHNGIKVYGQDNRGHGKSVLDDEIYGHIDNFDGSKKLVSDVLLLNEYIKEKYPDKKIVLFGHSMGSIIVRSFLNYYSNNISAAILCGTCGIYTIKHRFSSLFFKFFSSIFGKQKKSKFLNNLVFYSYNKKIKENKTDFDWLTSDTNEVDKYILDKNCGFLCTNHFFVDLLDLVYDVSQKENIEKINPTKPLLFISGSMDPVGEYKKGVLKSYKIYKDAKLNTHLKFYKSFRHEILNEKNKDIVYNDILKFLKSI